MYVKYIQTTSTSDVQTRSNLRDFQKTRKTEKTHTSPITKKHRVSRGGGGNIAADKPDATRPPLVRPRIGVVVINARSKKMVCILKIEHAYETYV